MSTLEEDKLAIARRQKIAEMLMEQGATPLETNQMAGGYVVPVSPLAGIAKVAQSLSGAYIGKKADEKEAKLRDQRLADLSAIDFNSPDASNQLIKRGMIEEAIKMRMKQAGGEGYQLGYDAKGNPFRFSKSSGTVGVTPGEDGGEYTGGSALYNPAAVAAREQAKEGQQGVKLTDPQGRTYYAPQAAANPQFKDYTKITGANQPPIIDISPDASPADRAMLEKIKVVTDGEYGKAPGGPIMGQSPAEEAAAKAAATLPYTGQEAQIKADINRTSELETVAGKNTLDIQKTKDEKLAAIKYNAEQATPLIDKVLELLPMTVSGGINSKFNSAMEAVGVSTDRAKAAAQLDAISADLVSKVPRAPGAQSDIELKYAQQQAGNLADSSKPWETRQAAAQYLKARNEKILIGEEVAAPDDKEAARAAARKRHGL